MAKKNGDSKRDNYNVAGILVYGIIAIFGSLIMLFGFGGLEDPSNKDAFLIYAGILAFLIAVYAIDKLFIKQYDLSYLHEPIKGIFSKVDIVKNPLKLLLTSLVIFTPIFLFTAITSQKSFVGFTQFQIAPVASVWTAVEPAVITETLIVSVLAGTGYFLAKRYGKKNPSFFYIIMGLTLVISTWFMKTLHEFRYGGQDFSVYSVIVFFFISILILQLTGSIIPLWVFHALNNGFGSAMKVFSSDLLIAFSVMAYILIFVYFVYVITKKTTKAKSGWFA